MARSQGRARLRGGVGARGLAALAVGVLAFGLSGCAASKPDVVPSDDHVEATVTVRAIDNRYEPAEVTIDRGQAVRWVFEGPSSEHDVVAEDGSFVSELMMEGSYTHVFTDAGEFDYLCSVHPEMRGVVTVE